MWQNQRAGAIPQALSAVRVAHGLTEGSRSAWHGSRVVPGVIRLSDRRGLPAGISNERRTIERAAGAGRRGRSRHLHAARGYVDGLRLCDRRGGGAAERRRRDGAERQFRRRHSGRESRRRVDLSGRRRARRAEAPLRVLDRLWRRRHQGPLSRPAGGAEAVQPAGAAAHDHHRARRREELIAVPLNGAKLMKALRVEPGTRVTLDEIDPRDASFLGKEEAVKAGIADDAAEIDKLQDRLYAEGRRALLAILQGTDTSGKDGTIRHVFNTTGAARRVGDRLSAAERGGACPRLPLAGASRGPAPR